jgi:hypothetical protein
MLLVDIGRVYQVRYGYHKEAGTFNVVYTGDGHWRKVDELGRPQEIVPCGDLEFNMKEFM